MKTVMKRTVVLSAILVSLAAVSAFGRTAQGRVGIPAPEIASQTWLNAEPTRIAQLKGKVVLVEFWTFGCYNCRNVEPHVKSWFKSYADQGFLVIGVHSPEFSYEHDLSRVKQYIRDHDIPFPVSIDNDFSTWNRYGNRYWPAMDLIDKQGTIR